MSLMEWVTTHTYSALWSYKIVGYKNPVVCVCTSEWSSESNTVQHVDVNSHRLTDSIYYTVIMLYKHWPGLFDSFYSDWQKHPQAVVIFMEHANLEKIWLITFNDSLGK